MKAIRTRYKGPTDFKGSRIIASDEDGNRITIGYDDALGTENAHKAAAVALCEKMNWAQDMIGGSLKDGYVFVFTRNDIRGAAKINEYRTCRNCGATPMDHGSRVCTGPDYA